MEIKKVAVLRKVGTALATTALATTAAVITVAPAQAAPVRVGPAQDTPPGCVAGFLWRDNGTIGGGYARCSASSGTAYQAVVRCQDYGSTYAEYRYGPWKNPGTGDSTAWCPSWAGATTVWVGLPD
jgi:hypothetical protein